MKAKIKLLLAAFMAAASITVVFAQEGVRPTTPTQVTYMNVGGCPNSGCTMQNCMEAHCVGGSPYSCTDYKQCDPATSGSCQQINGNWWCL